MKLTGGEVRRISIPLVAPFRTSFGVEATRDILLLRAVLSGTGLDGTGLSGTGLDGQSEGWGECVALSDPLYSAEYVDASVDVLKRFMLPRLFSRGHVDGAAVRPALVRPRTRRDQGPGALRGVGRHPRLRWRAPRISRGIRGRRVRSDQAEDSAGLGPGAGPGGAGAVRRRPAHPGRREHRLHPAGRPAPGAARRVRLAAHRAATARGGRARARRAGEADPDAAL